jgi:serine phosphatase RsbU (regulator of sigma subunit)/TPR repeat protein
LAQNFGDQEFYLIDSLSISKLSDNDKKLIDTSLVIYHSTLEDTVEFAMLENIVDNCWNEDVWPRYNDFLIKRVKIALVLHDNEMTQKKLAYFLAGALSNKGFYKDQRGDLLSALDYYHQSLMLYEQLDNKDGMSTTQNNLGVIYSIIGDTTKALEYHRLSLKMKKELKDVIGVAISYNNVGSIYENSNLPFKALDYYQRALKLSESVDHHRGIAMANDNIGNVYFKEKVYGKALTFYENGLEAWAKTGIEVGISTGKNNLANVLIKMDKWEEAKLLAIESYEVALKLGYPIDIENSARTLSQIYEHELNYKEAFFYSDLHLKMKDKLKGETTVSEAYKKSMRYEYQKESLKDSLEFQKERALNDVERKQQKTQSYALYGGITLLLIVFVIGLRSFLRKKKDNQLINEQKEEVEAQNLEIERQHSVLAYTHQEISDSITYAKRIQKAILPTDEKLKTYLKESFVLFLPKDVVSGDFYWIQEIEGELLVAVADCTGHGVPGAMVSIVCHNALNRAVKEFGISDPGKILDKTKEIVIETFETKSEFVRDGMDISLAKINFINRSLEWAGANNPLYLLGKDSKEIGITAANKHAIGKDDKNEAFKTHSIETEEGDLIYLFTDGFMDQFGGEFGKKYKYAKFREFLIKICKEPMIVQQEMLLKEFQNWKLNLEQVDDICIIGFKF